MAQIVMVGEGMVELSRAYGATEGWQVGQGGDTLNTAIHLARYGDQVRYFTGLGEDPFSDDLRARWTEEGIDTGLVLTAAGGTVGLYAIRTDEAGERTFSYWRGDSAARRLFELPGAAEAIASAEQADVLAYSLISLAILPPEGREALVGLAARMRAAGRAVAFDGNYRPRLWSDAAEARHWRDRAVGAATVGLPTREDEALLGDDESAAEIADRWRALGADQVVVKLGHEGCLLSDGTHVPPREALHPRDTSGAGDAFNAGYLHAHCAGASPREAAAAGHELAGWVVMRQGAVPSRDDGFDYPR